MKHWSILVLVVLFAGCQEGAYRYSSVEKAAIEWMFPATTADYLFSNTWVSSFPQGEGAISIYKPGLGVFVNEEKVEKFRYALVAVHEAIHVTQFVSGVQLSYSPPGDAYKLDPQKRVGATNEQQAEAARILALDYIDKLYVPMQANDEYVGNLSLRAKDNLWSQIDYLGIPRPDDWNQ